MVGPELGTKDSICRHLETNARTGLSAQEAANRLKRFGCNEISVKDDFALVKIFFRQFQSAVVLLLLVAQAISFAVGETLQASAILLALMINALIGFFTEIKARVSIDSLEKLMLPSARVVRDEQQEIIEARFLVPGDIVLLAPGDCVPADMKLIDTGNLSLDESALTGESNSVYKQATELSKNAPDDDSDEVFQGTIVQSGRGTAVVTATGANTRIGHLGTLLLQTRNNQTPLERNLDLMGAQLSKSIIVACVILYFIGILHQESAWTMIHVCIALAVAAIPEGMPVIATLALAAGTRKMAKQGALVRRLPAVETLGCTSIICTDKTGTLTENQMMVQDIVTASRHIKLEGSGYTPAGELIENGQSITIKSPSSNDAKYDSLYLLLRAAILCNDAKLENHSGQVKWHVHGDPTEGALLTAAAKSGLDLAEINSQYKRIAETPFSLERKMMSTIHQTSSGDTFLFVKGSPEAIFKKSTCCFSETENESQMMTQALLKKFKDENHRLAKAGLRVLAFAQKRIDNSNQTEDELILLGLAAMSDQLRPRVKEAIQNCKQAGIDVIMITGDQATTAKAIADKLELKDGNVLDQKEIEQMSDAELKLTLAHTRVLARTSAETKMKIVKMLQENGAVVAMTGDGVNDAPALRQADIGIAMGKNGTHLAREACDLILTDDNFATISNAIKEGRIIYLNIRKAVAYLLTASFSAVLVVAFNVLFHCQFYLNPIQLLWLNLIMHIFPGLSLALEHADKNIMKEPPRPKNEPLLSQSTYCQIWFRSVMTSTFVGLLTLNLHHMVPDQHLSIGFAFLSFLLLAQAWSFIYWQERKYTVPTFWPRKTTFIYMSVSYLFLLGALYIPGLNGLLTLEPLNWKYLIAIFTTSTFSALLIDLLLIVFFKLLNKKCSPCA
ncbi:MAG: cation-translocating P-type ATPase [Cyanobacteria bacterium TGS_CYA1]|nr:cation-translocating P-type ATPase [Cyanobacteria bacterium TGS_CYA1]